MTWDSGGRHSANHLQLPSTAPAARTAPRCTPEGRLPQLGRGALGGAAYTKQVCWHLDDADCPPRAASSIRRCLPDACVMTQRGMSRYGSPLAYRLSWLRLIGGVQNPSLWSFVDCSRTKESVEPSRTPAMVAALCSSQPASTSERAIALTGWWGKGHSPLLEGL